MYMQHGQLDFSASSNLEVISKVKHLQQDGTTIPIGSDHRINRLISTNKFQNGTEEFALQFRRYVGDNNDQSWMEEFFEK